MTIRDEVKLNDNTALSAASKATDHRHLQDRYVVPDRMTSVATFGDSTEARFGHSSIRSGDAHDPQAWVSFMAKTMDGYLNSDEWREAALENISCEFRPFGTEATAQQLVMLDDRNVEFDPRTSLYDRTQVITKGKAIAGDVVFSEACERAAMFSARVTLLDANMVGGMTEAAAEQTIAHALAEFQIKANTTVAKVLATSSNLRKVSAAMPTGSPREVAEDLIDILAVNVDTSFGLSIGDFTLLVPKRLSPILDRAAQRAGLEEVDELIGAGVLYHTGPEVIFVIPRSMAALSFREKRDGDIWTVRVSRNSSLQAWELEINGVADVMANALVRLKLANPEDPTEKLQTEVVPMPIITMIDLRGE
ncbi:hypothetical protein ACNFIC_00720 [Pseudomonas sp. NY15463]|uniref:hypothetical protein n=1 Tax=Pseudomonas sp. NY15463 TaxID=3400361 RepID=UPI003A8B1332